MERDVLVSIKGLHQAQQKDGSATDLELITPGTYHKRNGKQYVAYQEKFDAQEPPRNATIKLDQDALYVNAVGQFGGLLIFEKGKRNVSMYGTPFGTLQLGITTHVLDLKISEHNWDIRIEYSIDIDNIFSGDHDVQIKVQDRSGEKRISLTEKMSSDHDEREEPEDDQSRDF